MQLTNLFAPLNIGSIQVTNRIVSTGHDTTLPTDGSINDAYLAYQEARARGGVGLVILQVAAVHETGCYSSHVLMANDDSCIDGYRRMAERCHQFETPVIGQLFHPGREIMETADGLAAVAYSASAIPQERFHVMPVEIPAAMVQEIIHGYASAAKRLQKAGIDGVEIVASHGYLPAQFLNPQTNKRSDDYGGSGENRLRFLREVATAIRAATGGNFVVGLRVSSREMDDPDTGLEVTLDACHQLEPLLDYVSVVAGTSASLKGSVHIVPPMTTANAYLGPDSRQFKQRLRIPILVSGRINQPQDAEQLLEKEDADLIGMNRALICDPKMPQKTALGQLDDIRACIGCNQACIGHFHKGIPISCIQYPESGRELGFNYGEVPEAAAKKKVLIVGGGPAGLKAASVAARAGHRVSLYESAAQLGGQALLAQKVHGRAEFGGIVINLRRECDLAGVEIVTNTKVDRELVMRLQADVVIVATGGKPYHPDIENLGNMQVLDAWQFLSAAETPGQNVLISDWKADWIGTGIALQLATNGHKVKLAVNATCAGESIQSYIRTEMTAELYRLGVEVIPYMRLYGCDDDSVYLQHTPSGESYIVEGIDSLIVSHNQVPDIELFGQLSELDNVQLIGDALAVRTAEEAVFDGLKVAWSL